MFESAIKQKESSVTVRNKKSDPAHPSRAPNLSTAQLGKLIRNAQIQPKLKIGDPNDRYEQEADQMADRVMLSPDPVFAAKPLAFPDVCISPPQSPATPPGVPIPYPSIGRITGATKGAKRARFREKRVFVRGRSQVVTSHGDEPGRTGKGVVSSRTRPLLTPQVTIQRQSEEEEELLQPKAGLDLQSHVPATLETSLRSSKGSGEPLAPDIQVKMENGFGADFSGVRVHSGSQAAQLNQSLGAQAFTHGSDVYFNSGKYQPHSGSGQKLLAHELTHVVQQGAAPQRQRQIQESPEQVQRFGGAIRSRLAALARHLPGYTLMTVVAGYDPIAGSAVGRTASNLIGGLLGLIPFGTALYDKLVETGIIGRALNFVRGELVRFNLSADRFRQLVRSARDEMEIFRLDAFQYNLRVLRRYIGGLLADIRGFAVSLARMLLNLVKDALLVRLRTIANRLPGYSLLTKILRRDPLTGEAVSATTVQIIEEFLILIGQRRHLEKMRETGTVQRVANWIDAQLAMLNFSFTELRALFSEAWQAFSIRDLAHPLEAFRRTVSIFRPFAGRVAHFAWNVASAVLRFIKDALLGALTRFAQRLPGFTLLTVILGRNPFTGEPVARNATNLVRGFLEFVPGGREKFRNLQEAGALDRAFNWITERVTQFLDILGSLRSAFGRLWRSFSINDVFDPVGAFERVVTLFRRPVQRVIGFAIEVGRQILEFIFEAVMGAGGTRVLAILRRARATFMTIVRDPVAFIRNLIRAVIQGVRQFSRNILRHLRNGLVGWLFGALEGAGIQLPQRFDLRGIISLVLQILGLTYARIRPRLVRQLGERTVGILERTFSFLRTLVTEGPAAAWRQILEFAGNVREQIMEAIRNWVITRIVIAAVTRLASMFNPVGAVIQAIMAIYNTIMFFIERINQIMALVQSITNSIARIATGAIGAAANFVEQAMGRTIPVILSFLARLIGLGGISRTIQNIIRRIRRPIDRAIGRIVQLVVRQARRLVGRGRRRGRAQPLPRDPTEVKQQAQQELRRRLRRGRFRTAREVDGVVGQVYRQFRSHGLRSIDVQAQPGGEQQDVRFVFSASSPQSISIPLNQLFSEEDLAGGSGTQNLQQTVGRSTQTSYAALSVDGRQVGQVTSSGSLTQAERDRGETHHGHAEGRLVSRPFWHSAIGTAVRRAFGFEGSRETTRIALSINRSPCNSYCVGRLREALSVNDDSVRTHLREGSSNVERVESINRRSGLWARAKRKISFALSALGLYRGSSFGPTTPEDLASLRAAGWNLHVHQSSAPRYQGIATASGNPRTVAGQQLSEEDARLTPSGVRLRRLIADLDGIEKRG